MKYFIIVLFAIYFLSCTPKAQQISSTSVSLMLEPLDNDPPTINISILQKEQNSHQLEIDVTDKNWLSEIRIDQARIRLNEITTYKDTIIKDPSEKLSILATDVLGKTSVGLYEYKDGTWQKTPEKAEKRLAVLIANQEYQNVPALKGTIKETEALAGVLAELDFDVAKYQDLAFDDFETLKKDIPQLIKSKGYNVVLFYYSGHALEEGEINWLLPVNISAATGSNESVPMQEFMDRMENVNERTSIFILDACRSVPRDLRAAQMGISNSEVSLNSVAPPGTYFALATGNGDVAVESIFTPVLVEKLKIKWLTIESLFKQVRYEVRRKTNDLQMPEDKSSLVGEFIFNKGKTISE